MNKLITVTENGSRKKLSIMIDKVLHIEPLIYNSGETVTVITYINKEMVHVSESYSDVKDLINKS